MGQYFIITNLSKKEYIHPHDLKQGAKISEITNDKFLRGLMSFMSYNNKTVENMPYLFLGRWFNDKVILVGDYEDYQFFSKIINNFSNISDNAYCEYLRYSQSEKNIVFY